MNRLELFLILLALAVTAIIVIKSKWFDRLVGSLLRGTQSITANDLEADSAQIKTTAQQLAKDLAAKEAQIAAEKTKLNSL
jgi:nitrogen fixation/metabolism regulation signal transduction histidine kinase